MVGDAWVREESSVGTVLQGEEAAELAQLERGRLVLERVMKAGGGRGEPSVDCPGYGCRPFTAPMTGEEVLW
jgi:hypothetical protein